MNTRHRYEHMRGNDPRLQKRGQRKVTKEPDANSKRVVTPVGLTRVFHTPRLCLAQDRLSNRCLMCPRMGSPGAPGGKLNLLRLLPQRCGADVHPRET